MNYYRKFLKIIDVQPQNNSRDKLWQKSKNLVKSASFYHLRMGDIHTLVATLSVNMEFRGVGFNLLTISLWKIDSYQFSTISPKINK